jgi:hypothetical protein
VEQGHEREGEKGDEIGSCDFGQDVSMDDFHRLGLSSLAADLLLPRLAGGTQVPGTAFGNQVVINREKRWNLCIVS